MSTGCVWRGENADHYVGPLLFGSRQYSAKIASLEEQIHFPIVIESGKQWGLSVGVLRHITATPNVIGEQDATISHSTKEISRSLLSLPVTKTLTLSLFYLRIDRAADSEFIIRSLIGVQGSVGEEGNFLSAGLSTTRQFTPHHEGTYLLCHDSHRPFETTFVVFKNSAQFSPMPC